MERKKKERKTQTKEWKKLSQQQENTSIDERSEQNIKQKHKKKLISMEREKNPHREINHVFILLKS